MENSNIKACTHHTSIPHPHSRPASISLSSSPSSVTETPMDSDNYPLTPPIDDNIDNNECHPFPMSMPLTNDASSRLVKRWPPTTTTSNSTTVSVNDGGGTAELTTTMANDTPIQTLRGFPNAIDANNERHMESTLSVNTGLASSMDKLSVSPSLLSTSLNKCNNINNQSNHIDTPNTATLIKQRSLPLRQPETLYTRTPIDRHVSLASPSMSYSRPDNVIRRHASIGSKSARDYLCRQDSISSIGSVVSASSFSSLPPSPAVSFLSQIAEQTSINPMHSPGAHGWDGEVVGDYTIVRKIGVGAFAEVFDACVTNDMTEATHSVAVKIVSKKSKFGDHDSNDLKEFQARLSREITIWRQMKHSNIVRLFEVIDQSDYCFLFSEHCKNGHLLDYMNQSGIDGLSEQISVYIFKQVAEAVRYLHEEVRVVHRDLKPENILLTTDFGGHLVVKLCDFGLSEYFFSAPGSRNHIPSPPSSGGIGALIDPSPPPLLQSHACAGSLAYCAPEEVDPSRGHVNSSSYRPLPASDVWSLGVVLYAMVTGKLPFHDDYMPRLQMSILEGKYEHLPTKNTPRSSTFSFSMSQSHHSRSGSGKVYSTDLSDLVDQLLTLDPRSRISICNVLQHSWSSSSNNSLFSSPDVSGPFLSIH